MPFLQVYCKSIFS